jgi:hypothetical protein
MHFTLPDRPDIGERNNAIIFTPDGKPGILRPGDKA